MSSLPEIDFAAGTRFIGDLHLDAARSESCADFSTWLRSIVGCPRLVILGDLFDAWVGPAHARLDGAAAVLTALADLHRSGAAVDLIPGNRDFLLDADFEARTGASLRPEGLIGRLPGRTGAAGRVLCVHGDELCTLDLGYQRLKRTLRSGPVRWLAPRLPDAAALWVARRLRGASRQALARKPAASKAQQASAVLELAAGRQCGTLVCGHAHSFRDEEPQGRVRWMVVDAFGGRRDVLRVSAAGALEPLASRTPGAPDSS
jgi:UDP-2,3-diacylglucosamine hydrolase